MLAKSEAAQNMVWIYRWLVNLMAVTQLAALQPIALFSRCTHHRTFLERQEEVVKVRRAQVLGGRRRQVLHHAQLP
jgi:hypothetical protein